MYQLEYYTILFSMKLGASHIQWDDKRSVLWESRGRGNKHSALHLPSNSSASK